MKQIDLLI